MALKKSQSGTTKIIPAPKTQQPVQASNKKQISEELVVSSDEADSDDESVRELPTISKKPKPSPVLEQESSKVTSKKATATSTAASNATSQTNANTKSAEVAADSTDEEDDDSEEEDEEETDSSESSQEDVTKDADLQAPIPKVNGVKRKADSQDEPAVIAAGSKDSSKKKARFENDSAASVNGEKSSQDVQEQSTASKDKGKQAVSRPVAKATSSISTSVLPAIKPITYTAPDGYRRMALDEGVVIDESEFDGKELWHLTAPIGVPLDSISSLALDAIKSQKTVLTHNDKDYILSEDQHAPQAALFYPNGSGYRPSTQSISRSLSLRAQLKLPTIPSKALSRDAGSVAAANVATAAVVTIRPQPKGLRMRYKPTAFGEGDPGIIGSSSGESDDEDTRVRPTLQFPKALGPHPDGDTNGTAKKKKKRKSTTAEMDKAPNGLADDVQPAPQPHTEPKGLKKAVSKVAKADNADDVAKRKAEKRAKKLAKA